MSKEEKEKLVPNLRFKGFTDDWIQCELKDVSAITMGQSPSSENYTSNPTDHILVQGNADLKEGRVFPRIWTTEVTKTAEPNDIILTVRAPVGDVALNDYNVVLGRGVSAIKGNYFVFQLLKRMNMRNYWKKYSTGSTFDSINSIDINTARVIVPNKSEQNYIGKMLTVLDNIITLEQEKLEQYKLVYLALIQKFLISDSSTGPEIRIENHHQSWALQKVSDIFKITRGNVLAKSKVMNKKDNENIYPVFSSQTMNNGLMGYYNKYLFENAITWTTDGANAGTVTYRRDKFYSTNVNGVLLSEDGYASEVVALILNNTAYKYVSYVGNPKLMNNVMADIKIYLPTDMIELDKLNLLFVESKKVLHKMEQSILRYKNIKKMLLNNLFV